MERKMFLDKVFSVTFDKYENRALLHLIVLRHFPLVHLDDY